RRAFQDGREEVADQRLRHLPFPAVLVQEAEARDRGAGFRPVQPAGQCRSLGDGLEAGSTAIADSSLLRSSRVGMGDENRLALCEEPVRGAIAVEGGVEDGPEPGNRERGILPDTERATGVRTALLTDAGAFHQRMEGLSRNGRPYKPRRSVVLHSEDADGRPADFRTGQLEELGVLADAPAARALKAGVKGLL